MENMATDKRATVTFSEVAQTRAAAMATAVRRIAHTTNVWWDAIRAVRYAGGIHPNTLWCRGYGHIASACWAREMIDAAHPSLLHLRR